MILTFWNKAKTPQNINISKKKNSQNEIEMAVEDKKEYRVKGDLQKRMTNTPEIILHNKNRRNIFQFILWGNNYTDT